MNETVKLFIVNCGGCNAKQVWEASMKYKPCEECNSTVVLKTASPEDLKHVKTQVGVNPIRFSNYLVYSLGVEDVEEAIAIKRARIKQLKTDIEDRKKFAQMEKMNFSLISNGKRERGDSDEVGPVKLRPMRSNSQRKIASSGIRTGFSSKLGRKPKGKEAKEAKAGKSKGRKR
ncbi:MAG: hypothetical protein AABX01_07070 [Candidatus Micrarchaeota archaeon]